MKELEEEDRQERLGPGGLDPGEVYRSLPKVGAPTLWFWGFDGAATFSPLANWVQASYCAGSSTSRKEEASHIVAL